MLPSRLIIPGQTYIFMSLTLCMGCCRVNPGLSSVMGDNMHKLHQRQERLGDVQNKTEDLSNSAGSFAALAKQIRDREANKKWYQI